MTAPVAAAPLTGKDRDHDLPAVAARRRGPMTSAPPVAKRMKPLLRYVGKLTLTPAKIAPVTRTRY